MFDQMNIRKYFNTTTNRDKYFIMIQTFLGVQLMKTVIIYFFKIQ